MAPKIYRHHVRIHREWNLVLSNQENFIHLTKGKGLCFAKSISSTSLRYCHHIMSVEQKHEDVAQWQDALIPDIVDRLAHERGSAEYGEWVMGSSVVSITYLQLANVINSLAWWLVDQLGSGSHKSPEVLTYVGPNDVRYSAMVLAAIKAGYVVGLFSFPFLIHWHCHVRANLKIPSASSSAYASAFH